MDRTGHRFTDCYGAGVVKPRPRDSGPHTEARLKEQAKRVSLPVFTTANIRGAINAMRRVVTIISAMGSQPLCIAAR
jgi:hypothetical protein